MTDKPTGKPNRLIDETSPYLRQHAYNPVDWYPWGTEALEMAKRKNCLILLSVGYSACHWCHVMEHESFEDSETAQIMNENFVCIKVDREERPDLDKIYQSAHQLFNQRPGGWPLTAFLTSDEHVPVFVGTYFPDKPRHGMPAFSTVLKNISSQFQQTRDKLPQHSKAVREAFKRFEIPQPQSDVQLDDSYMVSAAEHLLRDYDPVYGGFGGAPKFPHSTQLSVLLAFCRSAGDDQPKKHSVIDVAVHTLEAMTYGGLYDQIGGGFYRYSVDAKWEIPHFEKMLYDNSQLIASCVEFGIYTGTKKFLHVALDSALWVIREMQSSNGGYFSTLDADSEGHEGKFYVWTVKEIKEILSQDEYAAVEIRYGLRGTPNFEGNWHLTVVNSVELVARRTGKSTDATRQLLAVAREKLFDVRSRRIRPGRDEKILASWNGLMIGAMAKAGRTLGRPDFIESAERAYDFVRTAMWKNNRLLATAFDDQAKLNAYLDDYAFLADGIIELLQARWRNEDLAFAVQLVEVMLKHYSDERTGAFYFTSDDHEKLLHRSTPTYDDATPSGNGVAASVLAKLGYLTGETRYIERSERLAGGILSASGAVPSAYGSTVVAAQQLTNPGAVVIISGEPEEARKWSDEVFGDAPFGTMVFQIPPQCKSGLPPMLAQKTGDGPVTAYVCTGFACSAVYTSIDDLMVDSFA